MNKQGQYINKQQFPTTAVNLINQVTAIPAEIPMGEFRRSLSVEMKRKNLPETVDGSFQVKNL